ncbi:4Fe-4S dicluster domain-containing protein [candidate division KSB1 bacterium]|nr:4Fe-4S dicluster domain-containing protein [candidate division KSB1 bacterium]
MNGLTYLKNVVSLQLDQEKCTGCRMCLIVCPHRVFEISNKYAVIVHRDACMECGACARNCPENAIFVNSGVGCATAVINSKLNRYSKGKKECCCIDEKNSCR